ncbi:hypothetical protein ARMSODRAFT_1018082 [Armillaria solidipes]|uniref:Uncharacterized protein n=1 Tax=Armillaria solidipes TaxID=1076256 RepID=A0A2H3BU67_9AGAR|nr:hypothetical protein ARMSODRAFT_1018082 [Armillaria solidipes]
MDDLTSNPLFILAVLDPPPPDCAINAVRSAYCTVFGRNPPADERNNQLLLWLRICCEIGVDNDIVKTTRRFFPSLPDLSLRQWNVAGRLLDLPEALETHTAVSKTIYIFQFLKRLQNEAELPEQNMLHRHEQYITAICHTLLSLAGFDLGSEHKTPTNKLKLTTKPLSYSIEKFDFSVQITGGDPNVIISIGWKHPDVQTQLEPVSWAFDVAYFLDEPTVLPPQFDRIEDTGFKSTALLVEFVRLMQEGLLVPLWENIRDNHPDIGSIDDPEADLHDTQVEGAEKTRARIRALAGYDRMSNTSAE